MLHQWLRWLTAWLRKDGRTFLLALGGFGWQVPSHIITGEVPIDCRADWIMSGSATPVAIVIKNGGWTTANDLYWLGKLIGKPGLDSWMLSSLISFFCRKLIDVNMNIRATCLHSFRCGSMFYFHISITSRPSIKRLPFLSLNMVSTSWKKNRNPQRMLFNWEKPGTLRIILHR